MTMPWVILGLVVLVVVAAVTEAVLKRNKKRPLSRLAQSRSRFDDPNKPNKNNENHVINVRAHATQTGEISHKSWKVSRDPADYAKIMMPKADKGKSK